MTNFFVWLLIIITFLYALMYSISLWLNKNKFGAIFTLISTIGIVAIPLYYGLEKLNL